MAALCLNININLFMLPPNSPALTGYVERAQLTPAEEFYEVTDSSFNIPQPTGKLLNREKLPNAFVITNVWAT
jgi:hypothetical protein